MQAGGFTPLDATIATWICYLEELGEIKERGAPPEDGEGEGVSWVRGRRGCGCGVMSVEVMGAKGLKVTQIAWRVCCRTLLGQCGHHHPACHMLGLLYYMQHAAGTIGMKMIGVSINNGGGTVLGTQCGLCW